MDMITASQRDISGPALSEGVSSESESAMSCPPTVSAPVTLANDEPGDQIHSSLEETTTSSPPSSPGQDEDDDDPDLQRAMEEMQHLDEILSERICKLNEAKCQRKVLQADLWQGLLQNKLERHSECPQEALNTKLFLALEAGSAASEGEEEEEEDDFLPLFETQVPESDSDGNHIQQSDKMPDTSRDTFETRGEEQFEDSQCGAPRAKKSQQRDFVKRNIELAAADGGQMSLTREEKQRLAELLRQIDEEEEDGARGAESEEDMWAVSSLTGQGYTPEPSDLEQLIDIHSKMRLILPIEECDLVQRSYANLSSSKSCGSQVGLKCNGDPQPGEKVLQDRKERRGLERRLHQIQQQLEILGQSPEMTDECEELTEEQLLSLLGECELNQNWSQELEKSEAQTLQTTPPPSEACDQSQK